MELLTIRALRFNEARLIYFYENYSCGEICDIVGWHILAVIQAVHSSIKKMFAFQARVLIGWF